MRPLFLFNIQRFSLHDGPGIRTAFFLKGCPMRCRWCHNPESQSFHAECMPDGDGRLRQIGQAYTTAQLIAEAEKDRIFYEQSGGGITLTGGEALAQDIDAVTDFLRACHDRGISTVVDTCGDIPYPYLAKVLPYTELFLYDIKDIDNARHIANTGQPNERILTNLRRLSVDGARINLRIPLLADVNDGAAERAALSSWIQANGVRIESVNLLPYHEFGRQKYGALGRVWEPFHPPDAQALAEHLTYWQQLGYPAAIGGAQACEEEMV